jgi:uncharacterized protein YgiM (DUF1202 family)
MRDYCWQFCWTLVALCVPVVACAQEIELAAASPQTFPYVAYIAVDGAQVHSGPGNAYYATDRLSRGLKVEVQREISGWLAISPPLGSFCWVPARDAELTDVPDVAAILVDDCPAWIGTRVEREADHVWQVQLNQGDHVKILDVKRRPGSAGRPAETWYRIEPPAGELRFIRAEDVTREEVTAAEPNESEAETPAAKEPRKLASVLTKGGQPLTEAAATDKEAEEEASDEEKEETQSVLKAQFLPRNRSQRTASVSTPEPTPKSNSPFKEIGSSVASRPEPRVASLDRLPAMDSAAQLSASSRFEDKLADIELQLSLLATRDIRDWQLETLYTQAEQLLASGQTTLERGRARLVLDKIEQFAALAERSNAIADLPRTPGVISVSASTPTNPAEADPTSSELKSSGLKVPDGVTYDGVGWLKPVYSAKRVAPPYALVDVDGKVLQYVTPSPGLNLNRYVKKPVGIFGQKSHLPEFKASHLTASKVVDLSKYQDGE